MAHRIRRPAMAGCLVLIALAPAACGGSSTKSAASTTTTGAGGGGGRFAAVRQCLAKSGINLPQRTPGQRRAPGAGGGGIFGGGGAGGGGAGRGLQLPAGVTQAQFQAALAKCGGLRPGGGARRVLTPAQRAARQAGLVKFAACMRQNGIALPAPNTTGTGPAFNTAKLNTTSPQFTAAYAKCASVLPTGFARGAGPPPGTGTTTTG